jgi:probable F420-dependent oxidoreductase
MHFAVNTNSFTNTGDFKGMIDYVHLAEKLGYDSVKFMDHVVGFVAEKHSEVAWTQYTHNSQYHECFVLMGYLAASTKKIRLVTGVVGLPQRQTALVAKQVAEIDILTGGRVTLGVGIGYNSVEFGAMGMSFSDRAQRFEEQIAVLRALWTQDVVNYQGKYHNLTDVNINPPPVQRPIPIWIGAGRSLAPIPPDKVLDRIGRLADGWVPLFRNNESTGRPEPESLVAIKKVKEAAARAGRKPDSIHMEFGLFPTGKTPQRIKDEIKALQDAGATHIHARLFGATPEELSSGQSTEQQMENLKRFADTIHALA